MKKALARIKKIDSRSMLIIVFLLFLISSVLRSVLACFPKSLQVFPDEIRYIDISRSLLDGTGIIVHNVHMAYDQILYPLFLIPFSFIKNQIFQITAIGITQAIIMSSTIFPVFLLGKKIIKDNWIVILLLITVLALPDFTMSSTFMSENLFYPITAWLLYFVYQFWNSIEPKDMMRYCVLSAVFCILAYLTKAVAVYLVVAFVLTLVFDCFFTKKNKAKQNIKYGVWFCVITGGIILGYKLVVYLILGLGVITYAHNFNVGINNFDSLVYCFYAVVYNGMFALIAFFYFPVVMPMFRFRKLNESEKNLLVFAAVSLVLMVLIITGSISINEDYPNIYMRQHTRYYAPLLIVFLTLFYKLYLIPREAGDSYPGKAVAKLAVFTALFCATVFGIFKFFSNVCIDGTLLQALSSFGKELKSIDWDPNEFHVLWQSILIKSLLVVGALFFTALLSKRKTQKTAACIFVILALAVCVANNYYSMKLFKSIYGKSPDRINQAITVNEYFNNLSDDGNILIITEGYAMVLDTYFTKPAYWTKKSEADSLQEDTQYIDLTTQDVISNYPSTPYDDLDTVKYIITDDSIILDLRYVDEIHLEGVDEYHIYVNQDITKIYFR